MPEEVNELTASIFNTIKKMIGGSTDPNDTTFDQDLFTHINTAIATLNQAGVGPDNYCITNKDTTWTDYLGTNLNKYQMVKDYIYLKTRILFDPPTSSIILQVYNDQLDEILYRLYAKSNF